VIAPLAKLMDWSAIQIVARMTSANASDPRLEEALQFLKGPDFVPADSQPAQMEFNDLSISAFHAPAMRILGKQRRSWTVLPLPERWQERPVIILLAGWNDSASYKLRFPLLARRFNCAGFNVATLVPPYHFQRRPGQRGEFESGGFFFWRKERRRGSPRFVL